MTKRLFTFIAVMFLALASISAQSLSGRWKADDNFKKEYEMDPTWDLFVDVEEDCLAIIMSVKVKEDDISLTVYIMTEGTFQYEANAVNAQIDPAKAQISIDDVETTDPEVKKRLEDPATRDAVLEFIKMAMTSQLDIKQVVEPLVEGFSHFTIKSLTQDAMTLQFVDDSEASFVRVE